MSNVPMAKNFLFISFDLLVIMTLSCKTVDLDKVIGKESNLICCYFALLMARDYRIALKGEFAPIYMVLGMVLLAVTIGTHTAKQQLMHSPTVYLNKKRRESIPEVEDPDRVISSADKFVNNSFLRKLAHIQDNTRTLPDPSRPDPYTRYICLSSVTKKTSGFCILFH